MGNQLRRVITIQVAGAAGTDDTAKFVYRGVNKAHVKNVDFIPSRSSTANASNNTTITCLNTTTSTTWITRATSSTGLTSGTTVPATLTEGTGLILSPGDVLTCAKTDSGTGVAASGTMCVEVAEIQS